jgi:hypothetical protein
VGLSMKVSTLSTKVSVTRWGKILPFWHKFLAFGEFFFNKKSPNDLGKILAIKKLVGRPFGPFLSSLGNFFTKTSGHPDFG